MPLYSTCRLGICAALQSLRLLAHWLCSAALVMQYCPSGLCTCVCERECECSTSFCILLTSSYLSIHTFLISMRMALTFIEFFSFVSSAWVTDPLIVIYILTSKSKTACFVCLLNLPSYFFSCVSTYCCKCGTEGIPDLLMLFAVMLEDLMMLTCMHADWLLMSRQDTWLGQLTCSSTYKKHKNIEQVWIKCWFELIFESWVLGCGLNKTQLLPASGLYYNLTWLVAVALYIFRKNNLLWLLLQKKAAVIKFSKIIEVKYVDSWSNATLFLV